MKVTIEGTPAEIFEEFAKRTSDDHEIVDALLREGADFVYRKLDGTRRRARGTLLASMVPPNEHEGLAKAGLGESGNVVYWDLDRKGFRQFDPKTVTTIDKLEM